MSCTRPLVRIPTRDGDYRVVSLKGYLNHSGKNLEIIADKKRQNLNEKKIKELIKDQKAQLLPCGQCPGCKMAAASSWANRMELELPYHQNAWFITFTYDDDNIPYRMTWDEGTGEVLVENYSLRYEDMQKFWKRLRRYMEYHKINNGKLMYFQCGEYGGKTHRPHYHAIVYDIPFTKEDLKVYKKKTALYITTSIGLPNYGAWAMWSSQQQNGKRWHTQQDTPQKRSMERKEKNFTKSWEFYLRSVT